MKDNYAQTWNRSKVNKHQELNWILIYLYMLDHDIILASGLTDKLD